jgi:hypothetical protein
VTLNTRRVVRLSAVLASLTLLLGVAATAMAAQGDENLPCPDGGHFILNDNTQENIDILVSRGLVEGETTGGVTHMFFNGPIDQTVFDMIMEGFEQEQGEQPPLVLSHCLEGEATPTPTPSQSQSATPTPSETPTATPTPSPTPEGSVAQGTSTPTPEGSVQGGTGTPEPSQPDTAMGVNGGPSPIPTVAFGLILLAALGTLAWANVKSARSRA